MKLDRRAFIAGVAGALALSGASRAAEAQEARVYRVGVILQGGPYWLALDGLREGLRELAFKEGERLVLDVRHTKGNLKLVEAAAKDLEQDNVDLIYAIATSVTIVVKRATKNVPIVFYAGANPVDVGLIDSFAGTPGGRLTGIHGQFADLGPKRLELLKELVPGLRRIVTFYNPNNPVYQRNAKPIRGAAHHFNVEFVERQIASVEKLRADLRAFEPREGDALLVIDAAMGSQSELIIEIGKAKGVPTMFPDSTTVARGGLVSYGASYYAAGHLAAKQVERILLGAQPGDLPVEQLDRLRLAINVKTAKALGLTIPRSVLVRANEVIE